jgi:hypothetical protein
MYKLSKSMNLHIRAKKLKNFQKKILIAPKNDPDRTVLQPITLILLLDRPSLEGGKVVR